MKKKINEQAAEGKTTMKRRVTMKKFTALALILVIAATIIAPLATTSAAVAFPGVSASAYCEFVATKTIPVYRDSACTTRGLSNPLRSSNAEIWANDKCKIITMTTSYMLVKFPSSSGELTGYIKTRDLFLVAAPQAVLTSKFTSRITTYVNTSGKVYGYTEYGDTVYNLGTSGNYIAIMYTAKSGSRAWMYGFVTKTDYDKIFYSTIVIPTPPPSTQSANYTPRMTAPLSTNSCYYSSINPFYSSGYGMPNCTAYAWGRAYELLGTKPNLNTGNACYWYGNVYGYVNSNDRYARGSTPRLGAIACWGNNDGGAGHVAVVEAINGNTITISESMWNGTNFKTTVINSDGSGYLSAKGFLGYIYIL